MKEHNIQKPAHVFGIDIGKNIFHVVSVDASGQPIQKAKFKRETLLQFFARAVPALIGMVLGLEDHHAACGSHRPCRFLPRPF